MNAVLRAMLEGVIDYAGLFPPAKLPMKDALTEYLELVEGPDSWIVDRFACNIGRLPDLAVELAEHPEEPNVLVSVIGTAQPDHKHWKHGLEHDAAVMTKFISDAESHGDIQAFEIRVPDHKFIDEYVRDLRQFTGVDVFIELPWGPEMRDSLAMIAEMESCFAKVRTGGLEASAYPSSADLADFIQQCSQLDLTFKLTAGLHNPLPSVDPATGGRMHGFVNVLTATAQALAHDLTTKEIEQILEETDPKAFSFKRDSVTVHEHKASLAEVENSRTLFVSFGSCSVAEPLEGLEKTGFLGKVAR